MPLGSVIATIPPPFDTIIADYFVSFFFEHTVPLFDTIQAMMAPLQGMKMTITSSNNNKTTNTMETIIIENLVQHLSLSTFLPVIQSTSQFGG